MVLLSFFFFFKQKTAYEMRISDWSSDVCSSDLRGAPRGGDVPPPRGGRHTVELERRRYLAAAAAKGRGVPMIDGSMQSYGLTLDKFLSYAAKWHPAAETVSAGAAGSVARIGYVSRDSKSAVEGKSGFVRVEPGWG